MLCLSTYPASFVVSNSVLSYAYAFRDIQENCRREDASSRSGERPVETVPQSVEAIASVRSPRLGVEALLDRFHGVHSAAS